MMILYHSVRRALVATLALLAIGIIASVGTHHYRHSPETIQLFPLPILLPSHSLWLHGQGSISVFWFCTIVAIMCGLSTALLFIKLIRGAPAAILTDDTLTVHPYGPIRWDDISDIVIVRTNGYEFPGIVIRNPQVYSAAMPRLRQLGWRINRRFFGAHFMLGSLTIPAHEARQLMIARWKTARQRRNIRVAG